jgi:hypothetical protein
MTGPVRIALLALAALAVGSNGASADEYPVLKPGQWEMTTTTDRPGALPQTSTICFDAALQKAMIDIGSGMRKELCSKITVRRVGAQFVTDAECRFGNSTVKSHVVMTMRGDTAYRTEAETSYDPPLFNDLKRAKTVVEAKHVGACRDGLVPGDIVTAAGQKLNIRELQKDRPAKGP